jgi:prepilin-type N-terminal cleavage/methylation domain-containing protein
MTRTGGRAGFSLVELIVAMTLASVVAGALLALMVRQMDFYQQDAVLREARGGARSALNVMLTDLRMVEATGGVVAAQSRDITVRVPYRLGIVCASSAGSTDVSLFPADSLTAATAAWSGWATRDGSGGSWAYRTGAVTLSSPGTASCTAASIATLTGGAVVRITPGGGTIAAGTPVFFYQEIRYRFAASTSVAGTDGLFRSVVATGQEEELVAPFDGTARFRFYAGWGNAQDDPPASLSTLRGLEIHLNAESTGPSPTTNAPETADVVTSVFFMNSSG